MRHNKEEHMINEAIHGIVQDLEPKRGNYWNHKRCRSNSRCFLDSKSFVSKSFMLWWLQSQNLGDLSEICHCRSHDKGNVVNRRLPTNRKLPKKNIQ